MPTIGPRRLVRELACGLGRGAPALRGRLPLAAAEAAWRLGPAAWGRGLDELIFPPCCAACRGALDAAENPYFCFACWQALDLVDWPVCQKCAARVPEIPGDVATCSRCEAQKFAFDQTWALGAYQGLLRELVLRMKQDRRDWLAAVWARVACHRLGDSCRSLAPDAIVPVPPAGWRRWLRGSHPPAAMADELSRLWGLEAVLGLLKKSPNARPQQGLSRPGRFRNIRGQIRLNRNYSLDAPHILLVDDVMTTGATCHEAAKVLKHHGARRVSVLVVGRTPEA